MHVAPFGGVRIARPLQAICLVSVSYDLRRRNEASERMRLARADSSPHAGGLLLLLVTGGVSGGRACAASARRDYRPEIEVASLIVCLHKAKWPIRARRHQYAGRRCQLVETPLGFAA